MIMSEGTPRKRYAQRSLAVVLALLGVVIFVLKSHKFVMRSFGLLAVLASMQLVRMSRSQSPGFGRADLGDINRPGRIAWFAGFALLLLAGFSFWFLYIDALHGYHARWPVYMFAGVGLTCAGVWGYIVAKLNA